MSNWAPKRFWSAAHVTETDDGFGIALDSRSLKTPAKAALVVRSRAMAEAIAAEWDAQSEKIDPQTMPVTRGANAAIDKVRTQHAEVAELLADYGGTDLLCYRAEQPVELAERQAAGWDPLLEWAAQDLGAPLRVTQGVIPVAQPAPALAALSGQVSAMDEFELAALHDLVSITGSLVMGLAVARGRLDAALAWEVSRIDEAWQNEQWGVDDTAAEEAGLKRDALIAAERFWALHHG